MNWDFIYDANRRIVYRVYLVFCYLIAPVAAILLSQLVFPWKPPLVECFMRWYVFFSVGIRLLVTGLQQALRPRFTAREMFRATDYAIPVVMELGFANICIGLLGLLAAFFDGFIVPAAVAGGLYHGLAGAMHALRWHKSAEERVLTITDLCFFIWMAVLLLLRYMGI